MARRQPIPELPPVKLESAGGSPEEQTLNLQMVLPSPGYPTMVMMVADVILRHVETAVFDFTPQAVTIRYLVDGVWHAMPSMDRENGDYMLATVKQLAGMNYRERRQRQEGNFKALFYEKKYRFRVVSQGIPSGERVGIYVDARKAPLDTLDQLGMRAAMRQQLGPLLSQKRGLFVISAMPTEGYTTVWRATLGACDRFLRDHFVVEEKNRAEQEVINVHQTLYDETKNENVLTYVPQMLLREPHVIGFPELADGNLLTRICEISVASKVLMLTRLYSRNAVEALPRLLSLKPDLKKFAPVLSAVLCMRLVRKLCDDCKQPYLPSPQLLAKLGIPPACVQRFFKPQPFQPGQLDEEGNEIPPCDQCVGIGYRGRTGVFELLTVNDALRAALSSDPKMDHLTAVAQQSGHVTMRDEAVLLVARGITSVEELQRVFAK
jgi:type II secretory ATPase GspE/PulE/Tfp pilus assembly ATPase PilB-like protein